MKGFTLRTLILLICITILSAMWQEDKFHQKLVETMDPFIDIITYFSTFEDPITREYLANLETKLEMLARRAIYAENRIAEIVAMDAKKDVEMRNIEKKAIKIESVVAVRSYVDDTEETMDIEFSFPNKEDMVKQLRDPLLQKQFLIKINIEDHMVIAKDVNRSTTFIPIGLVRRIMHLHSPTVDETATTYSNKRTKLTSINSIQKFTNFHTIKWLYYLLFCNSAFATKIRNLLAANEISVFQLCSLVGRVHELTSNAIHGYHTQLDVKQIETGLKLNGIADEGIQSCVYVLSQINKEKALFTGTLTTLW